MRRSGTAIDETVLCVTGGGAGYAQATHLIGEQPAARQVSDKTACPDALGYTMIAMAGVFSDRSMWDVARSQATALLAGQTPSQEVTQAVHRLASVTVVLLDAVEALAKGPVANSGLVGSGQEAMDAPEKPAEDVMAAIDGIRRVCS